MPHVTRRQSLTLIPASLGILCATAAQAEPSDAFLRVNAADSLQHYLNLVDKVQAEAYRRLAIRTQDAVVACNAALNDLQEAVKELHAYLHQHGDWPALRERFTTLETSLRSMQGDHPDEWKPDAVRSLPATTAALDRLLRDASAACQVDGDGHLAKLVDKVYTYLSAQNTSVAQVSVQEKQWTDAIGVVDLRSVSCISHLEDAAQAIIDGSARPGGWLADAKQGLSLALQDLAAVQSKIGAVADESIEPSSLQTLIGLIDATRSSLDATPGSHVADVAYRIGAEGSSEVPSVPLRPDTGLLGAVQALVRDTRYFKPGSTTQVVNCVAVCLPIWMFYTSESASDVSQRTRLIASALYFRLIWGTIAEARTELAHKLQNIYSSVHGGGTA